MTNNLVILVCSAIAGGMFLAGFFLAVFITPLVTRTHTLLVVKVGDKNEIIEARRYEEGEYLVDIPVEVKNERVVLKNRWLRDDDECIVAIVKPHM